MIHRLLPKVFLFLAANLLMFSESHAGASNKNGNPFGNGSFYSTGGTFNGVLRVVNLTGTTQFTTQSGTNGSTSYNSGPLVIYNASAGIYDDSMYVFAQLDPSANTYIESS